MKTRNAKGIMNQKVYGLLGIWCVMANWNADFTGRPKSLSDGSYYGSDKKLKYSVRHYLKNEGEKVLVYKTHKNEKGKVVPRTLQERYEQVFKTKLVEGVTLSDQVLENLFTAADVENFGAAFAQEKNSFSITGAVQVGQGKNIYSEATVEIQDVLSPYLNPKNEKAEQSSLGKSIFVDEMHYLYPFSVTPENYQEFAEILKDFKGYSEAAC